MVLEKPESYVTNLAFTGTVKEFFHKTGKMKKLFIKYDKIYHRQVKKQREDLWQFGWT